MTAQSFFKEFKRIISSQPKTPLKILFSENCEYGNDLYYCKDILYGFDSAKCTNSVYIYDSFICDTCNDCDYAVESQLCYESVDPFKAYNCDYLDYCADIRDSAYCHWCWNSNNLFGCTNLQNKSFCIFNRQLTETEYKEKVKEYRKWPQEKVFAVLEELKKRYPLTQTIEAYNENTTYGNYIHYNKNCYLCFDAAHNENCAYLYDSFYCANCFDMTYTSQTVELSYEAISSAHIFNSNYIFWSKHCIDSSYIFNSDNLKNCLGCVGLAHKQYCILNRQFTKEEYEKISSQILAELSKANLSWNDLMS